MRSQPEKSHKKQKHVVNDAAPNTININRLVLRHDITTSKANRYGMNTL